MFLCSNSGCKATTEIPTSEKKRVGKARFYYVNRRSVLAMAKLVAIMNMPGPVKSKSFAGHISKIAHMTEQVTKAEMETAGQEVKKGNESWQRLSCGH